MKTYQITIEWTINHTREDHYGFKVGTSKFLVKAKNQIEALNEVIENVEQLPNWEFERNEIDLNEYREENTCRYYYATKIRKILSVKAL